MPCNFSISRGYTAPEYAIRGELSEKADIYSFGVLVLEIISCRKNTDLRLPSEMQCLPEYAWKLYERSSVIDLPLSNLRPPMSKIVALLTCKVEMVGTPMRPAFLERRRKTDEKLSWDTKSENWIYNTVDKDVNRIGQKEQKKVKTDAQNLTLCKLECYCFEV
ncbi:hypothetical protein POTOM_057663 [Populus tomentosa]|uniref:Serine-threonine/tyrosine-protein kinase catalytic domain-containing protein n=1 Tax=Populus tomentosa TaxID=118781 RepID=A0A8X8C1Z4_POPTO|nr:hypothetical protein POTOM_057663 [Populus tomentosa]